MAKIHQRLSVKLALIGLLQGFVLYLVSQSLSDETPHVIEVFAVAIFAGVLAHMMQFALDLGSNLRALAVSAGFALVSALLWLWSSYFLVTDVKEIIDLHGFMFCFGIAKSTTAHSLQPPCQNRT